MKSLNGKIILTVILSLAIVLGISFYLLGRYQRGQLVKQMLVYSSQFNSAISYSLKEEMLEHEIEGVNSAVKNLEEQENIVRILLLNTEGKIAFSSKPEEKGKILKEQSISRSCRQTCHESMPDSPSRTVSFEEIENQRILRSIRYIFNITVEDTGIGISEEMQRKIFDPFFTTKKVVGTGLGLSVSYSIIQRHSGTIDVDSKEGQGTTFTIKIPISSGEQKAVEEEQESIEPKKSKQRILVAEDEDAVQSFITTVLTEDGHDVTVAIDGDEAKKLLQKSNYDIVITDLGMPKASGWEVAQVVKNFSPDTYVILISGYGLEMSKEEFCQKHVDSYLDKPIQVQELYNIINEALSSNTG